MTAWILLAIAIGFEIVGTTLLKLSDGFEKPLIGFAAIAAYSSSFWFFAPAIKVIPVGIAYAIWAGAGILAMAIIGLLFFDQRLGLLQFVFISLILIGAVGLRLTTDLE
ncbi:MAG: multidrug efflux SMR transporter [Pseudomonadota bacterium]